MSNEKKDNRKRNQTLALLDGAVVGIAICIYFTVSICSFFVFTLTSFYDRIISINSGFVNGENENDEERDQRTEEAIQ